LQAQLIHSRIRKKPLISIGIEHLEFHR